MEESKEEILLSIIICSVIERRNNFLNRILNILEPQIKNKPVELIVLTDNAKRKIGKKRNDGIQIAQGKYLCFIDDDDTVDRNYVDLILEKINLGTNPDVIVFDSILIRNGKEDRPTKFGIEYYYDNKPDAYYRLPNHLMVHRKDNVKEYYLDREFGEDDEWANRQKQHIKTQERIDKILYTYDYRTSTKKYYVDPN